MNIYKVKMSAYKIVPVTREVRITAEDTIEAELPQIAISFLMKI